MERSVSPIRSADLMAWTVLAPVFVAWPIVSTFPFFSIMANEKTLFWVTLQILFWASSFWGVSTVLAFTALTVQDGARSDLRKTLSGKAGIICWYALAWMAAYMAANMLLTP
jgi:hypothetical protein